MLIHTWIPEMKPKTAHKAATDQASRRGINTRASVRQGRGERRGALRPLPARFTRAQQRARDERACHRTAHVAHEHEPPRSRRLLAVAALEQLAAGPQRGADRRAWAQVLRGRSSAR